MTTSLKDQVLILLDGVKDYSDLAATIYKTPKLAVYVISVGLEHLASRNRATTRRTMRNAVIKPQFSQRQGGVTGSVTISKRSQRKLEAAARDLFLTWRVGSMALGEMTKEALLTEASNERASAKGHLRNAVFYEALAHPMQSGETVKAYWQSAKAVKLIRDEIWEDSEDKTVAFDGAKKAA